MNKTYLQPFSTLAKSIQIGRTYEHYKGLHYSVLAVARHTETLEELVVYQALYGDKEVWVRPLTMFLEVLQINAEYKPRFKMI